MDDQFILDPAEKTDASIAVASSPEAPSERQGRRQAAAMQLDATEETHLIAYVKVLYKRRWLAASVFFAVVAIVSTYTFTATPIFEATTRLLIEADDPNVVSFKQVIDEREANADYYQTQYSILRSRALARKTMEALDLFNSHAFARAPATDSSSGVVGWVKGLLGAGENAAPSEKQIPGADETTVQSRAIDSFLGGLDVSPVKNSRLVDVTFSSSDAVLATRVVNAIAKAYIDQNLEYKFLASKDASSFLEDKLKEERANVEAAELALQKYREQNGAISLENSENITVQKLTDLNAAVTRAKTQRIEKEALYSQLVSSESNAAQLDTFPAILGNSFVQQLKGQLADLQRQRAQLADKFGDQHPDMIKVKSAIANTQLKLDSEIRKVVQSVKSEYDSALSQEKSLTLALVQQKAEALSMNKAAIEYNVLARDVESSKGIYNSLMQRAKETGVSGSLRTSNIRVVDPAERPRAPKSPNKTRNIAAGFFGGALLAVALVLLFEYMDNRIKTPDEIKAHLGLPHLGLLPQISGQAQGVYARLDGAVPAAFAEAFRVLRTNVLFATATESSQSVLVTSTGPGEGKSLVASNLAISLAQAGRRVLLIDADMRKPKVHSVFDFQSEPGLSNVLVGDSKASDAVRKSSVSGLWVLPAGRIPPNPAELLGSRRFEDFFASLSSHFDWIVIDSPPVMAVADASVIAHLATGALFVVGAEMTSRHAASRAVEQLESAQGRFFGAVLNRADLERNSYYYSQYYRREYATYYTKPS